MNPPVDINTPTAKVRVTPAANADLARLRTLIDWPGYAGPTEEDVISEAITAAMAAAMRRINGGK